MIKKLEIHDINNFSHPHIGDAEHCKIPLFHGTRRYALEATDAERYRFYDACKTVILFAQKIAFLKIIDDNALEAYQRKANPLFSGSSVVCQFGRNSLYEYGDLYITSGFSTAFSFTHNAGGELGEWAYRQCEGFKHFSIELDEKTYAAVETVQTEYEKYNNSEKAILIFFGVNFKDMLSAGGDPFWVDDEYMDEEIADLYDDARETDNRQYAETFRLINLDKYTPHLLREKDFRKGFELFTDIKDLDGFIKSHNMDFSTKWAL